MKLKSKCLLFSVSILLCALSWMPSVCSVKSISAVKKGSRKRSKVLPQRVSRLPVERAAGKNSYEYKTAKMAQMVSNASVYAEAAKKTAPVLPPPIPIPSPVINSADSILHIAIKRGDPLERIEWFIKNVRLNPKEDDLEPTIIATPHPVKNPLVNALDSEGKTPLHHAAIKGKLGVVRVLIENGAILDIQDKFGNTALHYAIENEWARTVDFLCKSGANLMLRNNAGISPIFSMLRDSLKNK